MIYGDSSPEYRPSGRAPEPPPATTWEVEINDNIVTLKPARETTPRLTPAEERQALTVIAFRLAGARAPMLELAERVAQVERKLARGAGALNGGEAA